MDAGSIHCLSEQSLLSPSPKSHHPFHRSAHGKEKEYRDQASCTVREPMHQSRAPFTRQNGQQQSCEACRKWKIRCDHTNPVCQRCLARNIGSQCFYHPAPMTKRRRCSAADSASGNNNDRGPEALKLVIINFMRLFCILQMSRVEKEKPLGANHDAI
jgi:hypothetical protein